MLNTLALLAALATAPAADSIPATWQIKGDVAGNPLDVKCTFVQTGATLGGSCDMAGTPVAITGEVKEGKITFQHGGDYNGEALTIVYAGTLASPTEIKGTVTVKPFDVSGEFTATAAPAKP